MVPMSLRRCTKTRLGVAFDNSASRGRLWRQLAATEAASAQGLQSLARRQRDVDLRELLGALASDADRHAAALGAQADTMGTAGIDPTPEPFDFTGGRHDETRDRHGFPISEGSENLGAVACLATLQVAVLDARELYQLCGRLAAGVDSEAGVLCRSILEDLDRHLSNIDRALELHRGEHGDAVRDALRTARRSPFMAAWKRTGMRSGGGLSRGMLYVFYWTLLLPFGLVSRRSRARPGCRVESGDAAKNLRSQY